MKRKYHGLFALIILFFVLTAAALYTFNFSWQKKNQIHLKRLKPMPNISIPGPNVLKEMERLEKKLASLAYPAKSRSEPVNLSLFGYRPFRGANRLKGTGKTFRNKRPLRHKKADYTLTFAFSSGNKSFCIINGAFYTAGSSLPGEEKIIIIESKRIMIDKSGYHQWITMSDEPVKSEANSTKEKPLRVGK